MDAVDFSTRLRDSAGRLVPPLAHIMIRTLGALVRIETDGEEGLGDLRREVETGLIFNFWHGEMLLPIYHLSRLYRGRGRAGRMPPKLRGGPLCGLVSMSRDGEYINGVLRRLGWDTVRGSSSRGGIRALFELARRLSTGQDVAVVPDGPRGPRRRAKPGSIHLARHSGAPIIPVGVGVSRGFRARSWDRFLVPAPFSRALLLFGHPFRVDPGIDRRRDLEAECRRLSCLLNEVSGRAEDRAEGIGS